MSRVLLLGEKYFSFLFFYYHTMKFISNIIKDLKSAITIIVTIAFVVGYFMGLVEPKDFFFIVGMVFTFYFTKKDKSDTFQEPRSL